MLRLSKKVPGLAWPALACLFCAPVAGLAQTSPTRPSDAKDQELAVVEGVVRSSAGEPLRKAVLTLEARDSSAKTGPYITVSDEAGAFAFSGVAPGAYKLTAERAGYTPLIFGARGPSSPGRTLILEAGQHLKGLSLVLMPEASVLGRVIDAEGDPVAGAQATLFRFVFEHGVKRIFPVEVATCDSIGEFKMTGVSAGAYFFAATGHPVQAAKPAAAGAERETLGYVTTFHPGVSDAGVAAAITIPPGAKLDLGDITLKRERVFHIRGALTGDESEMVARGLEVAALAADFRMELPGQRPNVEPKRDGTFDLGGVPSGTYVVAAYRFQGRRRILAREMVTVGSADVDRVTLEITAPVTVAGRALLEEKAGTGDAKFDAGMSVVLISADAVRVDSPEAKVAADGAFLFDGVGLGKYIVHLPRAPKGTYLKAVRSGQQDLLLSPLDLSRPVTVKDLTITLGRSPAHLSGSVTDDDDQPVGDAIVTLIPDPPRPIQGWHSYRRVETNPSGAFRIDDVAPGEYCLYAWDSLERSAEFDADFLQRFAGNCSRVAVEENGSESRTLRQLRTR